MLAISCAALGLIGCNYARDQGSQILSELSGQRDNQLIDKIQSRNPGSLCALTTADGHARLMSYGNEAVVDVSGTPILLTYHLDRHGDGSEFTGSAIEISGKFTRERAIAIAPLKVVSRDVTVQVKVGDRTDHFDARWTCQPREIKIGVIKR